MDKLTPKERIIAMICVTLIIIAFLVVAVIEDTVK